MPAPRAALGAIAIAVGCVVSFGIAEAALRTYAAVNERFGSAYREFDPTAVQIEPSGAHGYKQRPNSVLHYGDGTIATSNALGYRGPEVPRHPSPGTVRIVLFGGSTTHGWGVSDSETIDAHMRTLLKQRFPDRRFEVVNLALDGYDSYQLLERLRLEGLAMDPTVVVFNEGINDVRDAWYPNLEEADRRTLIWETVLTRLRKERDSGGPTLWTLLKHYSFVLRAPGYARQQVRERRALASRTQQPSQRDSIAKGRDASREAGPPYPDAAVFFERHVREFVNLSLEHGAAVLLSTPPSALRWYEPTATSSHDYWIHDAQTTQAYRDTLASRLRMIASQEHAAGRPVAYVSPVVEERGWYLDDCHLTSAGNRAVAANFIDALIPLLESKSARPRSAESAGDHAGGIR